MEKRLIRRIRRLFLDRRAVSSVLANVMLASVVLSLGFGVQYWVYWRSTEYNNQYGTLVDDSIAKMKEKLVFERIFYNGSNSNLTVYLINCGRISDTSIATVSLRSIDGTWEEVFYGVDLRFLNGTTTEELDILEEGHFQLHIDGGLVDDTRYAILMITGRGKAFVTTFMA